MHDRLVWAHTNQLWPRLMLHLQQGGIAEFRNTVSGVHSGWELVQAGGPSLKVYAFNYGSQTKIRQFLSARGVAASVELN